MTKPNPTGSLLSSEPVIVGSLIAAAVGYVLSLLVARGVITSTDASSLTEQVVPAATAGALVLLGMVTRMFVSPASKVTALQAQLPNAQPAAPVDPSPAAPVDMPALVQPAQVPPPAV